MTLVLMSFRQIGGTPLCTLIDTAPRRAQHHLPVSILRRLLSLFLTWPFVTALSGMRQHFDHLLLSAFPFIPSLAADLFLIFPLSQFCPPVKLMHFVDSVRQWAQQLEVIIIWSWQNGDTFLCECEKGSACYCEFEINKVLLVSSYNIYKYTFWWTFPDPCGLSVPIFSKF